MMPDRGPSGCRNIENYWLQTLALAESGMTYAQLLRERFPELDAQKFAGIDLKAVCHEQIDRVTQLKN